MDSRIKLRYSPATHKWKAQSDKSVSYGTSASEALSYEKQKLYEYSKLNEAIAACVRVTSKRTEKAGILSKI